MKNNKNELDQWLRQNAGTGAEPPASDGWDTPSDAVWQGLRARLYARKKRRRFLVWWLAVGTGLVVGVLWFLLNERQVSAPPVASGVDTPSLPPARQSEEKTLGMEIGHEPLSKDVFTRTEPKRQRHADRSAPVRSFDQTGLQPQRVLPSLREGGAGPASSPETTWKPRLEPAGSYMHATPPAGPMPLLSPLPPLPLREISSLPEKPIWPNPSSPAIAENNLETRRAGWCFSVDAATMYTGRTLKNTAGAMPNGTESGAWVAEYGLRAGWMFRRHWSVETGISRTAIQLHAQRLVGFRYRLDREQYNAQRFLYQNAADQTVETAFGAVDMRMDVGREPSRPVNDQALLLLRLQTDEQVHYLRIPVALRWSAGAGAWQWSLAAGVGLNIKTGYNLQVTAARSDRPGIRNVSARARNSAAGLQPLMLDAAAGAGLAYRLAPHWQIRLTPEFRHGLSPVSRRGDFRTLAVAGGATLGIVWTSR